MSKRSERTEARAWAHQAAADHLANYAWMSPTVEREEALKLSERMRTQAERLKARAAQQRKDAGE